MKGKIITICISLAIAGILVASPSYNNQLNCILVDFTNRITSDMINSFKGITI
jgi:hypothetical protein